MQFQESLEYLYGLQLFGIKLGLSNMQDLALRLPQLQQTFSAVHVAGTNGKGSVSAYLAEILRHSGLKVGLYTSPHLHCFTERIRIDGQPVSREYVAELATKVRNHADDIPLTFFEATTAMALLVFQEQQVDMAVIETGLGGRLDATNVIEPRLALITPVSYDHREHLGDSLDAIAREKAGIIKPGVPVVAGRQVAEVREVLEEATREQGSLLVLAERDYQHAKDGGTLSVTCGEQSIPGLTTVLEGAHQLENYAQAVVAALQLRGQGVPITDDAIREAGQTVKWPARLEWWSRKAPRLLLDVAHNLAGFTALSSYLAEQGVTKIKLVAGLSGEREPSELLAPLRGMIQTLYAVPVPGDGHVPPERLAEWAAREGVACEVFDKPVMGLNAALDSSVVEPPIVVAGSLYLVAALRESLAGEQEPSIPEAVGFA